MYAKFTIIQYRITYYLNGGTNASENPDSYIVGTPIITLSNPKRASDAFTGWYGNAECSGAPVTQIDTELLEHVKLYAGWQTATYNSKNLEDLDLSTISVGYTYTIYFTDTLNNKSLDLLASKIEKATSNICLDMSKSGSGSMKLKNSGRNGTYYSDFANCKKLKRIILPEYIEEIDNM